MLDYLEKFNKLPKDLRDKVSTRAIMSVVDDMERKYKVNLASLIMRVMIKEVKVSDLALYLVKELNLDNYTAVQLAEELQERVFFGVVEYLEIKKEEKTESVWGDSPIFSKEDKAEIKELAKKINGEKKKVITDKEIETRLDKIVEQAQINFGTEELALRFRNILKTYLRGIRDIIDTKGTLTKPLEAGGLGFDQEAVDKVLKIVDLSQDKAGDGNKIGGKPGKTTVTLPDKITTPDLEKDKAAALKSIGVRDVDYDLSSLKKLDVEHEIAPPPPSLRLRRTGPPSTKLQQVSPPPTTTAKEVKPEQISEQERPLQEVTQVDARSADKTTGKIKMEDVKAKIISHEKKVIRSKEHSRVGLRPKIMGPVDELGYMDLINFRRLDQEPNKIIAKIKEKIDLLEEESYAKRLEGIKAWRNSPVNKLYLEMGQASISENKAIDAIIKERKTAGKEFLSDKEFEAITDLNKSLRF